MPNDAAQDRSPADIRAVFSQNLTEPMGASQNAPALCRELSLNRTQFNRYLAGESFHSPIFCKKYAYISDWMRGFYCNRCLN
jgi:hypothetical protein